MKDVQEQLRVYRQSRANLGGEIRSLEAVLTDYKRRDIMLEGAILALEELVKEPEQAEAETEAGELVAAEPFANGKAQ